MASPAAAEVPALPPILCALINELFGEYPSPDEEENFTLKGETADGVPVEITRVRAQICFRDPVTGSISVMMVPAVSTLGEWPKGQHEPGDRNKNFYPHAPAWLASVFNEQLALSKEAMKEHGIESENLSDLERLKCLIKGFDDNGAGGNLFGELYVDWNTWKTTIAPYLTYLSHHIFVDERFGSQLCVVFWADENAVQALRAHERDVIPVVQKELTRRLFADKKLNPVYGKESNADMARDYWDRRIENFTWSAGGPFFYSIPVDNFVAGNPFPSGRMDGLPALQHPAKIMDGPVAVNYPGSTGTTTMEFLARQKFSACCVMAMKNALSVLADPSTHRDEPPEGLPRDFVEIFLGRK